MKRFMFSLVTAAAALMLGCQNPDSVNPVASTDGPSHGAIAKPLPVPAPRFILFDRSITYTNAGAYNEVMRAVGKVSFEIKKTPTTPIFNDYLYDVDIIVAGEISKAYTDAPAPRPAPWSFAGSSKDRIKIPDGKKVRMTRTFAVQGASVPTILNVELTISQEALAVRTVSLTKLAVIRLASGK